MAELKDGEAERIACGLMGVEAFARSLMLDHPGTMMGTTGLALYVVVRAALNTGHGRADRGGIESLTDAMADWVGRQRPDGGLTVDERVFARHGIPVPQACDQVAPEGGGNG